MIPRVAAKGGEEEENERGGRNDGQIERIRKALVSTHDLEGEHQSRWVIEQRTRPMNMMERLSSGVTVHSTTIQECGT